MDYNTSVGGESDIQSLQLNLLLYKPKTTMIYFFESQQDLAMRGGGVMSWDGDPEEMWGDVNPNNISGADFADIIEMIGRPASEQIAMAEEEYRDEREDSSRLADRYGC